MTWVRAVVVAFGVSMAGFSAFWARFSYSARRSGELIGYNAKALLAIRIWTYLAIGVFFVLLGAFRSQWFAWAGVGAMFTKLLAEGWFRRRERRSDEGGGADSAR